MRPLLIIPAILFALVFSARALNTELSITPSQLDEGNYKFSVTATVNATNQTLGFHIFIKAKSAEIPSKSEANLVLVAQNRDVRSSNREIRMSPFMSMVPISLNKNPYVWTADFTLPRESFKTPGLCFVFAELAYDSENEQRAATPTVTFYEIKLKDFVKE